MSTKRFPRILTTALLAFPLLAGCASHEPVDRSELIHKVGDTLEFPSALVTVESVERDEEYNDYTAVMHWRPLSPTDRDVHLGPEGMHVEAYDMAGKKMHRNSVYPELRKVFYEREPKYDPRDWEEAFKVGDEPVALLIFTEGNTIYYVSPRGSEISAGLFSQIVSEKIANELPGRVFTFGRSYDPDEDSDYEPAPSR
ncbi:hypothetical protein [Trueperella sp. LYQ141]|uniref:hypothetical protein n=1 Tax=Trueperella sp. LYQ141 TaxID=3391058 RepID=UPI003982EF46